MLNSTHFDEDKRIKFVGTVYDTALLCSIRSNAFAYIHGHEVGGTNPSLLESLATTKINLLLDVAFNREVGGDCAYYWLKEKGSLSTLIDQVEQLPKNDCIRLGESAKQRIQSLYSWDKIVKKYEYLFLEKEVSSDGALFQRIIFARMSKGFIRSFKIGFMYLYKFKSTLLFGLWNPDWCDPS